MEANLEVEDVVYDEIVYIHEDIALQETEILEDDRSPEKIEKVTRLPLTRIKTIMKMDPDVSLASQEAVFLITKATMLQLTNWIHWSFWKVSWTNEELK